MAGIYIHIPFCKRRCIYCDFFSTTQSEKKPAYVHALCQELNIRKDYLEGEDIETIYLGGGTPSQLTQEELEEIFSTLYNIYKVKEDAEITLEANPDDLTPEYVAMLRQLPINRISMGIQTFQEETLKLLHRRHTAKQAIEAFERCREAGFQNISIDLMYGLPGETLDTWKQDLQQAIALHPEHISAYHLIYEEDTALWKLREQHQVEEADEDLSLTLFTTLIDELTGAGYQHYEISNFCLPGLHSRHNSSYWTGKKYLGCGPSAHSFNGTSRQWNVASLSAYIDGIQQGKPDYEIEELDLYVILIVVLQKMGDFDVNNTVADGNDTKLQRDAGTVGAAGGGEGVYLLQDFFGAVHEFYAVSRQRHARATAVEQLGVQLFFSTLDRQG